MSPYSRQLHAMGSLAAPEVAPDRADSLPPEGPGAAGATPQPMRVVPHEPVEMRRAALTTPRSPATPLSPIAAVLAWLPPVASGDLLLADPEAEPAVEAVVGAGLEPEVATGPAAEVVPEVASPATASAGAPGAAAPADAAPSGAPGAAWLPQAALGYVPAQRTRGAVGEPRRAPAPSARAVVALVAALVGLSPLAVVLGHVALRGARRAARRTRDLATAALALGYLGLLVEVVLLGGWLGLLPGPLAGLAGG